MKCSFSGEKFVDENVEPLFYCSMSKVSVSSDWLIRLIRYSVLLGQTVLNVFYTLDRVHMSPR